MSAAFALLAQQPVAFWLAVVGVLTAGAIALGRPVAVGAALGVVLGALVAAVDPRAELAQAAAAAVGVAAVLWASALRRRRSARSAAPPDRGVSSAASMQGDVRLLGRTARTRAAFVAGRGEVEVDGATRPAHAFAPDEVLDGDVLVRIVRVSEAALVVRPITSLAG